MGDTIFALATAQGRAALAVIRVSGPDAGKLLSGLSPGPIVPRQASLRTLRNRLGEVLDQGLVVWFPRPNSYTGEDVVELHVHGGPAIVDALAVDLLARGARFADPGEFTRRAFEAGRLDLTQAEAVADLVDAETDGQRRQALAQLGGEHLRLSERWRSTLIDALAHLEAQIDFADEDIPETAAARAREGLQRLLAEIRVAAADTRGEQIRSGLRVALIGSPNAGKSSLLNSLIEREAAIVAPTAGTTRDVIEAELILRGYKVILADTAGIRGTVEPVEVEGVRRARARAGEADLRLLIVDGGEETIAPDLLKLTGPGDILVFTKVDLDTLEALEGRRRLAEDLWGVEAWCQTSIHRPATLTDLRERLASWAVDAVKGAAFPVVTRERHRNLLVEVSHHLERALRREGESTELIAEDVRLAARSLERLSGRIGSEDVLDHIFGSFCIGK